MGKGNLFKRFYGNLWKRGGVGRRRLLVLAMFGALVLGGCETYPELELHQPGVDKSAQLLAERYVKTMADIINDKGNLKDHQKLNVFVLEKDDAKVQPLQRCLAEKVAGKFRGELGNALLKTENQKSPFQHIGRALIPPKIAEIIQDKLITKSKFDSLKKSQIHPEFEGEGIYLALESVTENSAFYRLNFEIQWRSTGLTQASVKTSLNKSNDEVKHTVKGCMKLSGPIEPIVPIAPPKPQVPCGINIDLARQCGNLEAACAFFDKVAFDKVESGSHPAASWLSPWMEPGQERAPVDRPFWIMRREVRVKEFLTFLKETEYDERWEASIGSLRQGWEDERSESGGIFDGNDSAAQLNWQNANAFVKYMAEETQCPFALPSIREWRGAAAVHASEKEAREYNLPTTFIRKPERVIDVLANLAEWSEDTCSNGARHRLFGWAYTTWGGYKNGRIGEKCSSSGLRGYGFRLIMRTER